MVTHGSTAVLWQANLFRNQMARPLQQVDHVETVDEYAGLVRRDCDLVGRVRNSRA